MDLPISFAEIVNSLDPPITRFAYGDSYKSNVKDKKDYHSNNINAGSGKDMRIPFKMSFIRRERDGVEERERERVKITLAMIRN